ncbi:tRNA lysidine(34) synthetase TilS [Candidatus Methylomirabilis sp.]|uniref:tRNA lysidine(34) synthetase TilS n=1 Tax=Candidatus Methylomirabilis sp. TaxID=2032687 RepID=UPI002A672DC2|nr:tRNA lysidine(34) synthetase TilS [Candidatus Methylomirabilis sp.]
MRDALLHRAQETIDRHRMLVAGEMVVLAVSGGVDSMVMLNLLLRLRIRYHISLHVAHLNHDLRGAESAEAADFVRRQCEAYQIPVTITTADGRALRERGVGSLQAAARDLRYRFLEQVANERGADSIAVGHHRDDQAETVLMNLLRGSGVRGLGGIPPVRGRIIRPLIDCSREEIERYARKERIPYVEDSSNRSLSYGRNRIRLELLPRLAKRYNPRIVHALANTARILEAEDTLLNAIVEQELGTVLLSRSREELVLSIPRMATLPTALRWRIIRRSAEYLRDSRAGLTFQQILLIDRLLLTEGAQGTIQASGGLRARRAGAGIVLSVGEGQVRGRISSFPLAVPGLTVIPDSPLILRSDLLEEWSRSEPPPDTWTALLDADCTGKELHVRGWEEGDRFVPLGMDGRKKLQDFFVDAKVPRNQRGNIPLVVSGGQIVWVVGFRVDERFKVTDSTRRILRLRAADTGGYTG